MPTFGFCKWSYTLLSVNLLPAIDYCLSVLWRNNVNMPSYVICYRGRICWAKLKKWRHCFHSSYITESHTIRTLLLCTLICWVFMCPVYVITACVYVLACTHIICVGLPLQAITICIVITPEHYQVSDLQTLFGIIYGILQLQ